MKFWLEVILSVLGMIVVLFIGTIPMFIFQYMGWSENESLDLLSRMIGFIICLVIMGCYFDKAK